MFNRSLFLIDQSVMSHYRNDPSLARQVDELAVSGVLCSCVVTMDEARFSARNRRDLDFITELYGSVYHWLPGAESVDTVVKDIRSALWRIGAGRGAQTTDVQIAAVAICHDATVIHNDTDFETIARAVPNLSQRRIRPSLS